MKTDKIRNWKDAIDEKALRFNEIGKTTLGFKVVWWLWSADIWYGKVPLLKSLVVANVLVWLLFV